MAGAERPDNPNRSSLPAPDGRYLRQPGPALKKVDEACKGIEANQADRIGHEVGKGVDIVEVDPAVARTLKILDAADVGASRGEDPYDRLGHPGGRLDRFDLEWSLGRGISRAELELG